MGHWLGSNWIDWKSIVSFSQAVLDGPVMSFLLVLINVVAYTSNISS